MRRLHPHWHHHRHHLRFHDGRTPFPWDRVMAEARRREPGWRRRIRTELRLHYGAHLHSRLAHWFGAAIFLTVITTLCAAHMGRAWLASHPWRAVVLFGIPAFVLWRAAGRIARRISRPLYELTRVAQKIGAGELSARASTRRGYDEIDVLASTFNDMAARLERQLTEQRELLAAVSHELRTPLARIRLLVEIGRQAATGAAPEPETLNEIEREAIEIDTLVGELLASARLEFQAFSPKPIDATEVARRALERAGEPAAKLGGDAPAVRFPGDPTLVARALANLIDNARKHGGGLDGLTVRTRAGTVVFEITDRGPGFKPGEEARIFDRFYGGQGEGSQAHHGSLGLGLSLVQRIAAAHGGVATAANRPTGGAILTLEFPTEGPVGVT